ncbi:GDSL-type esterase/lipase family protein [Mucilaginibacter endophyticus]|uniref:GDSL-type esterase/lipase family protein n=1 Tax=Mucilaginibacter endophyticus TaxID=2675003 RepID=UPI000E0D8E2E|nr:GDSL-type esterase/lipase family protein [Mucilaginibacter endophyticus]
MKNKSLILATLFAVATFGCKKAAQEQPIEGNIKSLSVSNKQFASSPRPVTIVIIGASTAAGMGATPIDSSWVNRLRLRTANNPRPINYINLAKGGLTSYQGVPTGFKKTGRPGPDTARNITKALSYRPDLVMITYPSNDIAEGFAGSEVLSNFAVMVHLLDSAKINYMVFGTQPRDFTDSARRQKLRDVSTQIKAIYGVKSDDYFSFLSTSSLTIQKSLAYGDGIHVNNNGHLIILNTVLNHPVFKAVIAQVAVVSNAPIGSIVSFKGNNKAYASSENGQAPMTCNRPGVSGWEKYTVVDAGNGKIALMNKGKYVSSENGTASIRCNKNAITDSERFDWVQNPDGTVSLKSTTGAYISSENGRGSMTCYRRTISYAEKFSVN